ncbi:hypothetical protein KW805_00555 [Candidatus Pacearchaeota archaeon]|nr:hypothetical protein [Candidatus Pacearchaeota archaeon]
MGRKYTKWEDGKEVMYEETPGIFAPDRRIGELEERSSLFFYFEPGKYVTDPETKEDIHVSNSDIDDHRTTSIGGQSGSLDTPNFGDPYAFTANRVFVPDKKPEPSPTYEESDDSSPYDSDSSSSDDYSSVSPTVERTLPIPDKPRKKKHKPRDKAEPPKEKIDPYIARLNKMSPSQLERAASWEEKDKKLQDYAIRRTIMNKENNIFRLAIVQGMNDPEWSYESRRRLEQIFDDNPHLTIIRKRIYELEAGRLFFYQTCDPEGKRLIEEEEKNLREYNAYMAKMKEEEERNRPKGFLGFLQSIFGQ